MPHIPSNPPVIININFRIEIGSYRLGITYDEIAVRATTINVGAPISPELTAVSPITRAVQEVLEFLVRLHALFHI